MAAMDDLRKLEAKGLARAKIRSKRRRTGTIRRRTFRGSIALFLVLWAVIFGQLAAGNDPALSRVRRVAKRHPAARRTAPPAEAERSEPLAVEPEVQVVPAPEPAPEPPPPVVTSSS